jgi:hypothetical protein
MYDNEGLVVESHSILNFILSCKLWYGLVWFWCAYGYLFCCLVFEVPSVKSKLKSLYLGRFGR